MEKLVRELVESGINVELLVPARGGPDSIVGVRLRTYGKSLPKNKMVLGSGKTFDDALKEAIKRGQSGHWDALDWAARPWPVEVRGDLNLAGAWGLS